MNKVIGSTVRMLAALAFSALVLVGCGDKGTGSNNGGGGDSYVITGPGEVWVNTVSGFSGMAMRLESDHKFVGINRYPLDNGGAEYCASSVTGTWSANGNTITLVVSSGAWRGTHTLTMNSNTLTAVEGGVSVPFTKVSNITYGNCNED